MRRLVKLAALIAVICALQGCAYMRCRANDFLDIVDIGLSFSSEPQYAAYLNFASLTPLGHGDVQGNFVGIGGGQLCGWSTHRERSVGLLLWGHEQIGFGYPDLNSLSPEERQRALNFQHVGALGLAQGPFPVTAYLFSCVHYLHLWRVGGVFSVKYLQALDFLVGWTTFDICADDDPNRLLVAVPPEKTQRAAPVGEASGPPMK